MFLGERVSGGVRHPGDEEIAVVGWACRLPGASSVDAAWSLLTRGSCAITQVPSDRFSLTRFGYPGRQERGKSYTWAAGVLDNVFGFDCAAFGISPREAEQMDPQQRLLLELTWEALEDAGVPPSSLAREDVGVFLGASLTEYANALYGDPAVGEAQFAVGNALAVLANRISYIFDFHGPSVAVDTACSSSLVALHQATEALRNGRVETAIVGGVNIIASPLAFITFSQASMLSPSGLCRAFSGDADGFVRAEGGVVLVLQKASAARKAENLARGFIVGSDVNSDGRTNGILLPSSEQQQSLIERVYGRLGLDPNRLAFVEAHGTGTPAGDPIEARAIGRSLGCRRSAPLPIGSIKTNIGHLEPASGLAGVLKSLLALNHGLLPRSLHFSAPNPNIDFQALNLEVAAQPIQLPNARNQFAGVNSFGFGGTNAHVVLAPARPERHEPPPPASSGRILMISTKTKPALRGLAARYKAQIESISDEEVRELANAAAYQRDQLSQRLVIPTSDAQAACAALQAFANGEEHPLATAGVADGAERPIAFVYSGNGSQWAGMGQLAYLRNPDFRERFDAVDRLFEPLSGWSLKEAMFDDRLIERLPLTSVAQPLIFAIQVAMTAALRAIGIKPSAILGHSVGEVAAAEAAGILSLSDAVKVIHFRSTHQEIVRGHGRMATVSAPIEFVRQLLHSAPEVEIAAYNSPSVVTIAGPADALGALMQQARQQGVACLDLELDYPFHTASMAPVEVALRADLQDIVPQENVTAFFSTVSGGRQEGKSLNDEYWWRNVRDPVQFTQAVREAFASGARYFIEIGPRGVLGKHVIDSLQEEGEAGSIRILSAAGRGEFDGDPFERVLAQVLAEGGAVERETVFGARAKSRSLPLPSYPWQRETLRFQPTPEAIGVSDCDRTPLAGARFSPDSLEWHVHIDTALFPELEDHRVGGQTIFPGTGFLEIGLSVARQWLKSDLVILTDFEILKPLHLGELREIMTRVSPGSNTIEILSRPRLSQTGWILHCRTKMGHGAPVDVPRRRSRGGQQWGTEQIYRIADSNGLQYGPAFRQAKSVVRHSGNRISVELIGGADQSRFVVDPARLDACTHGFLALFPDLCTEERGVTYIPARLEEIAIVRPFSVPQRAVIEVRSANESSIVSDYFIYGRDDELIVVLRGVRGQSIPVRRIESLDSSAVVEIEEPAEGAVFGQSGLDLGSKEIRNRFWLSISEKEKRPDLDSRVLLFDGLAAAVGFEIAGALAGGRHVDLHVLIGRGKLPAELRTWFQLVMQRLVTSELAKENGNDAWILAADAGLPSSSALTGLIAREHPEYATDILLAAALSDLARQIADKDAFPAQLETLISPSVLEYSAVAGKAGRTFAAQLRQFLNKAADLWPLDRTLRILQVGFGPLTQELIDRCRDKSFHLTILEADPQRYQHGRSYLPKDAGVELIDPDHSGDLQKFDLILACQGLTRATDILADLCNHLAKGGLLIAIEPRPTFFSEMSVGLAECAVGGGNGQSRIRGVDEWLRELAVAGLEHVQAEAFLCEGNPATLLVAQSPHQDAALSAPLQVVILGPDDGMRSAFAKALKQYGGAHALAEMRDVNVEMKEDAHVVLFLQRDLTLAQDERLARECIEIKDAVESIGDRRATLWIVLEGARGGGHDVDPVETGVWAFTRVLANEFPTIDVRRVDIGSTAGSQALKSLAKIIVAGGKETEIRINGSHVSMVRVGSFPLAADRSGFDRAERVQLLRRTEAAHRVHWAATVRKEPDPQEVEIEVEATGLNFRDLMWALALLPDDILEGGYAGPTLGLECAGRVTRTGSAVKTLQPGDRVLGFVPSSFASHALARADQVWRIPDTLSAQAAASIPVAFLTAWYSLITLARLKAGEQVLIHSAAGAVGMAAVQIARSRNARVIATAGSPAKRALLHALGAGHVFDSRSLTFVDDVRRVSGEGVDIVLNSLAGEAMERSLSCLRPFGRFIELGKRDYVANTHIGLRPLRKNLSYFGVDVDQLVGRKRKIGLGAFKTIMKGFGDGTFTPLPHSVFAASEATAAFDLMQRGSHIGKIIVRPPDPESIIAAPRKWTFRCDRTHLVTGGLAGFGLATAKWLVEQGARHLVLVSRRGANGEEAQAALQDFARRGINVMAESCDVSDREALAGLLERVRQHMPPLTGVIHAAMVLDDSIIANLDEQRLRKVFAPKVLGATYLDELTREEHLDYLVFYSSVTTLFGNPGQAAYVAANAFMEGLARRRRQAGKPALAIGWGPITDVGVVARSKKLSANLQNLNGARGMTARAALEFLPQALARSSDAAELGVVTIAPNDGLFGANSLPVLRSPTYAGWVTERADQGEGAQFIDIRALLENESLQAVREKVIVSVTAQVAQVLRFQPEDINPERMLGELGLDSLMALEVALGLERTFAIELSLSASVSELTITKLADGIIAHVTNSDAVPTDDMLAGEVAGSSLDEETPGLGDDGSLEASELEAKVQ